MMLYLCPAPIGPHVVLKDKSEHALLAILVTLLQVDSHMVMQVPGVQESHVVAQGDYVSLAMMVTYPQGDIHAVIKAKEKHPEVSSAYQYIPCFPKYPFHFSFYMIFLKFATILKKSLLYYC